MTTQTGKQDGTVRVAGPRTAWPLRVFRRMGDCRGIAALEFALLAIPFFSLLFAIIEVALALVMNQNLSNAAASTARQIRVGGSVAAGAATTTSSGTTISPADFKAAICAKMPMVSTAQCVANLQVDVRTLASFTGSPPPNPLSGQTFSSDGFCFYSGAPGDTVEMRSYYLWSLTTPLLWPALTNVTSSTINGTTSSGHWLLVSSTNLFVNEPNGSVSNNGSGC